MINENIVEYDKFLNRLLIKHRIGSEMDNGPYSEMDNRVKNYPNIRKCLIGRPIDIDELLSHLRNLWPLGAQTDAIIVQEFLKKQSSDILQKFIDDILENTNAEIIEKFIKIAVNAGLRPKKGNGKSTCALFTSVLLSAMFPDRFVDFRHKQWDNLFKLLNVTNESLFQKKSTYGEKIIEAGRFAGILSKLPTFIKYFKDEYGLWKVAGLAWHFSQPIVGNKRYFVANHTSDTIYRNNLSNMEEVDWKFPVIGDNVAQIEQYKNTIKCVRNGSEVALKINRERENDIEIVFVGQVSSVDI